MSGTDVARRRWMADGLSVLAAAAACVLVVEWSGHRQWHLWDLSMVVDAAWRTYLGQRPGVDFISPLPVGFHALGGLALWTFGVSWSSFVHVAAVWACLCVGWEFVLLRLLGASRAWAAGIAVAITAVSVVQKSFLYHSAFTTPVAAVLVTAWLLALRSPRSVSAIVSVGASCGLLLLGKQNALLVVGLVVALTAATPPLRLRAGAALALGAAAAIGVVLFVAGSIEPTIRATLAAGAMRARPNLTALLGIFDGLGARAFTLDAASVALVCAPLLSSTVRRRIADLAPRERLLLAGAAATALYGMATNNDLKMTDLPPLIVAVFIPAALGAARTPDGRGAPSRAGLPLVAIIAIGVVAGMARLTLSGSAARVYSTGALTPAGGSGSFFAGLVAGPRLAIIEQDMDTVSAQTGGRRGDLFFGPALEFGYAAHGDTPPLGLPVWWHPGTSYPPSQGGEIARRFAAAPPAVAVFLPNDAPGMPAGIADFLRTHYTARAVGSLVVLERRGGA